ncbi:hypothetical protein K7X08_034677 [Anisodus acutangulus]|uniref:Pentatricopeptide repeat-containing protein n=1 Tax=Anisodus acutangulus TaxID=402998 RepID=A0A9Q1LJ80_9SOLA|nr:hypothetical protein K7X08_034677 [Anisodus acutangulus]
MCRPSFPSSSSTTLWNQIISGHARSENPQKCIKLFNQMEKSTAMPDGYTYSYVLNGCVKGGLFREGQQLHGKILKQWSLLENVFVQTNLVNLYSTTGGGYGMDDARKVFDEMIEKNAVTWWLFLSACAELGALDLGKWIHSSVVESSQFRNEAVLVSLYNALIHMCASCGEIEEAYRIFEGVPRGNSVSWTSMITGFAKQGMLLQLARSKFLLKEQSSKILQEWYVSQKIDSHLALKSDREISRMVTTFDMSFM